VTDTTTVPGEQMPALHRPAAKEQKMRFEMIILILTLMASAGLLFLALPDLFPEASDRIWLKASLLGFAAMTVSYGVNRFALDRGAPLAVLGYPFAAAVSVLGITTIGAALFASTYAGLVLRDVGALRLQETLTQRVAYVASQNAIASRMGSVAPAVEAAQADLLEKGACELATSCVSGRGDGGRGPVYRALVEQSGRALSVAIQLSTAERDQRTLLEALNSNLEAFQETLSGEGSVWEKYRTLQVIDAEILQAARELEDTTPVGLISAYAGTLRAGATIPERPNASDALSRIMEGHGVAIEASLARLEDDDEALAPMPFPLRPGVGDTFGYIGHFWPVAAIAFVVELILPISLWIYTAQNLAWIVSKHAPVAQPQPAKRNPFAGLLTLPGPNAEDIRAWAKPAETGDGAGKPKSSENPDEKPLSEPTRAGQQRRRSRPGRHSNSAAHR